jgi:hypothetical protein
MGIRFKWSDVEIAWWWRRFSRGKGGTYTLNSKQATAIFRCAKKATAVPSRQPLCQAGNSLNSCVENLSAGQQKITLVYLVGPPLSMTHYDRRYRSLDGGIFLAKIKGKDFIGPSLSMTHYDRRLRRGVTHILLGKDKRKGFDWPILIYDSPGSSITKGVTHILLG